MTESSNIQHEVVQLGGLSLFYSLINCLILLELEIIFTPIFKLNDALSECTLLWCSCCSYTPQS